MQLPLLVLVLVGSGLTAPSVLVLQPLLIGSDVQGSGNPQLLLAAAPQGHVVLVSGQSGSNVEDNGKYVEKKYEDYNEDSKSEGTEDYNEKTEEYNEKTEEYNEKTEEYNEKTENYDEKYEETSEGTEDYNETTPSTDYVEKDDDTLKYETKDYDENAVEGSGGLEDRAGKSSEKREISEAEGEAKQLREEVVFGSQNKGEVTSTPAVVKLAPPLKETEEVQLAPVVYHVSPKELHTTTEDKTTHI